jgi:hypothetical protein
VAVSVRRSLGAVRYTDLGEYVGDVMSDGAQANNQLICDLLVRLAVSNEPEDL